MQPILESLSEAAAADMLSDNNRTGNNNNRRLRCVQWEEACMEGAMRALHI